MSKKSTCDLHVRHYYSISEVEVPYSIFIANCVFNACLSYTAIMLNIVTIHAIRKTSSLPRTLKTLLLSLSVSDVGVGLLIQPFAILLQVKGLQESYPACSTYKVFEILLVLFSKASFYGVIAISVDRFLTIRLHLRYQELVTHKRVVVAVILIWVLSAFVSSMVLWVPPDNRLLVLSISTVIGLLLTTLIYIRIYSAVRHHKNQIQVLQAQHAVQTGEIANFAGLIKSVVGIFYIYLVFLVCYLPMFISLAALRIYHLSTALNRSLLFSVTLVFVNSSLNPVIYSWRMRHIRNVVMNILQNISWHRNRALR